MKGELKRGEGEVMVLCLRVSCAWMDVSCMCTPAYAYAYVCVYYTYYTYDMHMKKEVGVSN